MKTQITRRGATRDESVMRFSGGGPLAMLPMTTRVSPFGTSLTCLYMQNWTLRTAFATELHLSSQAASAITDQTRICWIKQQFFNMHALFSQIVTIAAVSVAGNTVPRSHPVAMARSASGTEEPCELPPHALSKCYLMLK